MLKEQIITVELNDLTKLRPFDKPGDIVLIDNAPSLNVLTLCIQNDVRHVIQKSNFNSQAEIQVSSLMLNDPNCFIDFPLSSILGEENPSVESEKRFSDLCLFVENASQKKAVLSQFESYLLTLTPSKSLVTDILTVVDESLTNSIYNAPFVDVENSFSGPTRDYLKIKIDPSKKPCLFVGHDKDRIVVGCRDLYGTLNVNKLIDRIKKCYELNPGEVMNFGEGGAGIGSFMIFDSCASMYVAVDSGVSTTVCCSFPLKMSATRRSQIPKNLHIIHR